MAEETDEEIALALVLALTERARETVRQVRKHRKMWKRSAAHKMPVSWSRTVGWRIASRHEAIEGLKVR
jgi:hypothetical protein